MVNIFNKVSSVICLMTRLVGAASQIPANVEVQVHDDKSGAHNCGTEGPPVDGCAASGRSPTPTGAMIYSYRQTHSVCSPRKSLRWLPSCGSFAIWAAHATPEIGEAAPALVVNALDGTTFDLAKLRGKVVLVNYWATWCAPCRKEMPKLDAFYRRYHAQGLEIIGISIDFERDFEKARKAAQAVTYPTAVAKAITDDGFGIPKGVPITWIIDVDGKVRDRLIDVRDELLNGIVVPLLPR